MKRRNNNLQLFTYRNQWKEIKFPKDQKDWNKFEQKSKNVGEYYEIKRNMLENSILLVKIN